MQEVICYIYTSRDYKLIILLFKRFDSFRQAIFLFPDAVTVLRVISLGMSFFIVQNFLTEKESDTSRHKASVMMNFILFKPNL